jgi:hypothetical protein
MYAKIKSRLLLIRWRLSTLNRAKLLKLFYRLTRPGSDPFVSGDGLRKLANHVYDETERKLAPARIRAGDVVFVSTDYARKYLEEIDPQVQQPYVLVTHNSDLPADESLILLAGDNVSAWFAQNNSYADRRVTPVPIGLENLHHYHAGIPRRFVGIRNSMLRKKNRILVGFAIGTNAAERQPAFDGAMLAPCADVLQDWLDQDEYAKTLAGYKFVLSPPGNGLDAHRTWEAMYLGVVPIVKDSVAMRYFAEMGLPLWVVAGWEELRSIDERQLELKYEQLEQGFRCPALFMDYWRNQILSRATSVATGTSPSPAATFAPQQPPNHKPE